MDIALDPDGFVSVETSAVISFEPIAAELITARGVLRSILATMAADAGQVLHGVIEGTASAATDLDNALLYNIGGKVANATRYGVSLERRTEVTDVPARYRYKLADATSIRMPAAATTVALLNQIPMNGPPRTWADVWAAVRPSERLKPVGESRSGDLCLDLRLAAPAFVGCANGALVKTVIDGVLTALHAHEGPEMSIEISERLAVKTGLTRRAVHDLLLDHSAAALGPRRQLIALRAAGVQCSPDDLRVAWARIVIDRSVLAWGLSGQVATTAPQPASA